MISYDDLVIGYKYDIISREGKLFRLYYTGRYGDSLGPVMTFSNSIFKLENVIECYQSEFFSKFWVFELNTWKKLTP